MSEKYNGTPKSTYYRRLKEWTLTLYDKEGNEYHVSPKHVMKKGDKNATHTRHQINTRK